MKFIVSFLFCIGLMGVIQNSALGQEPKSEYAQFCSGTEMKLAPVEASLKEVLFRLQDTKIFYAEKDRLLSLAQHVDFMSEKDRVELAEILYMSRSLDLAMIHDLLAFQSSVSEVEISRLAVQSRVDLLLGLKANSLKDANSAAKLDWTGSSEINLLNLTRVQDSDKVGGLLDDIQNQIDKMDDSNPRKKYAEGTLEIRKNGWTDKDKIIALYKSAYEKCQRDQSLALAYGYSLIARRDLGVAKTVLEQLVSDSPGVYPTSVDVILGELYLDEGQFEKATKFIEKAIPYGIYLDPPMRKRLLDANLQAKAAMDVREIRWHLATYVFAISLTLSFFLHVLLRRRK